MTVNVPDVAGVPLVNFALDFVQPVLLLADALGVFGGVTSPVWGIFLDGVPVVVANSVISMEYKDEYTISDFPLEQGAFESYDKVQVPFTARVRFVMGGSSADRAALLASIDAIVGDLNFYDVVTPDAVYSSANVVHRDYRRTAASGVGLLQVDVWLEQVRVSQSTSSFSPQSPGAAAPTVNGTVQPTTPTAPYVNAAGTITGVIPPGPPQNFPGQP